MMRPMNFRMPTDDAMHTAFEKGEAALRELFHHVADQMTALAQPWAKQGDVRQELQARLAQSSRNSSQPPSSDGYGNVKRTASVRKAGDKPNGGQPGHAGQTLLAVEHAARTWTHAVPSCTPGQASLPGIEVVGDDERQVCALPAIRIAVTAHRAESKVCPACGHPSKGTCPEAVIPAVQ
jgi:transposase